jgi:hypothetical protein
MPKSRLDSYMAAYPGLAQDPFMPLTRMPFRPGDAHLDHGDVTLET